MEEGAQWRPTRSAKYGVVIYQFEPEGPYPFMKLKFGELVQIVEENGGWYRGFSLRNRSNTGIFPASHVQLKDCSVTNPGPAETIVPKEDPMMQEITDVLRDWDLPLKKLYMEGKRKQFQELIDLMKELLDRRRQILSKTLPRDELRELKQKVASRADYGNRLVNLDMIPREENGEVINPKTAGVMHLFKVMRGMSQNAESATTVTQIKGQVKHTSRLALPTSSSAKKEEHHLFLKFSALALPVQEPCDLLFFLYDGKQNKVLSERYMISLSQQCLPKNPDKIGQCFAVFTDLDTQDLQNKDLYLACQVIRVGNELEGKKTAAPLRKPHGAGLFSLHGLLTAKDMLQEERETQMDVYVCSPSDYHRLLENILKKQGVFHQTDRGTGVFIGVRVLKGPITRVREENKLLFTKFTAIVKKLSFAEIIRPYDERHDVYLTLQQGVFGRGNKRADKNVQVDVEVLGERGETLPFCICPGVGEENISVYNSLVHYHLSNPTFAETFKLEIPPDRMKSTRVRFSFYHKSTIISSKLGKSEPFAMSHLRLMKGDDTTIRDGEHELYVYSFKDLQKNPGKLSTLPDVATGSLSGPQDMLYLRDCFSVITRICSTKLTQNADLHGLLNWQSNQRRLETILDGLQGVGGDEIVKFLADTFNALFAIVEEKGGECGDSVFKALVFIIGLLAVERFENFRPVLDTYCDNHFSAASVHTFLVKKFKYVTEQVMVMEPGKRKLDSKVIVQTMKAAEFLFKFMMRSRLLYDQATQGKHNATFIQSLEELLRSTCNMMSKDCPEGELIAPRAQAQAMQFFPQIFPLLLTVISVKSLAKVVADFLQTIKETKLRVYKSVFLSAVVQSQLFTHAESRAILLPSMLRHLQYHIKTSDDSLEKSLETLGNILDHLHNQSPAERQDDMKVLVKEMLQDLLECFNQVSSKVKDKTHPQLGLCVSNLLALTEMITPEHYRAHRASFELKEDLEEFFQWTFSAYSELITLESPYPADWMALRLLHNHVILKATQQLSLLLVEDFLGDGENTTSVFFNSNLWEKFFLLAVDFCCQPSLQLEDMTDLKRNKILAGYQDMRVAMNSLMLDKWHKLGNFQSRFIPNMIGAFLRVSLLPHIGLRKATIPIFFDMMEYEWKFKRNFHLMETEMIDKLDLYVSAGAGDSTYRKLLQQMLTERCKGHQMAESGGMKFIESLVELLRRLLDYRAVPEGDEYHDMHMHVVFNLLKFYKSIGREEIYLRYIYRLAELHKLSGNYVEAAFTLLLHAQLLQWSNTMLKKEGPYFRQSASDRKMALYMDIISYFDKGKLWECGIEQCKEIASQLESVTFDYEQLSQMHQTISRFYTSILRDVRAEPMYFRVGFYGGFAPFLKNKVFVFRGHEYEKLGDFNSRISGTHPHAKFLKTLEPPGLDVIESTEQYLQSCSVDPIPEPNLTMKFEGKEVKDEITRFYRTNHVKQFVLKRPFHKGTKDKENEYKTLHIERTVYTTEDKFPGILRWFEVTDTDVQILNPVENGAELIQDNISQLKVIIARVRAHRQNTSPLTMKLNGTLDAAVNGGVSKFDDFFSHTFLSEHPEYKVFIPRLKHLMEELGRVCIEGVDLHNEVCPDSMKALHKRMEELLSDYLSRYGDQGSESNLYDAVALLDVDQQSPKKRRLSSSRRRVKRDSASIERLPTVSGMVTLPEQQHAENASAPPIPEHRNRAQTEGDLLTSSPTSSHKALEAVIASEPSPPKVPTKQRRSSITQLHQQQSSNRGTPPPLQHSQSLQVGDTPPTIPSRRGQSSTPTGSPARSRPTSFSSSGEEGNPDLPRPPPRIASVRPTPGHLSRSKAQGSRESLDKMSPSSSASNLTASLSASDIDSSCGRSVKDIIQSMSSGRNSQEKLEATPPPIPRKMHKLPLQQSSLLQLKNGASVDESSS